MALVANRTLPNQKQNQRNHISTYVLSTDSSNRRISMEIHTLTRLQNWRPGAELGRFFFVICSQCFDLKCRTSWIRMLMKWQFQIFFDLYLQFGDIFPCKKQRAIVVKQFEYLWQTTTFACHSNRYISYAKFFIWRVQMMRFRCFSVVTHFMEMW